MERFSFKTARCDGCLYWKQDIWVLAYVDDIIVIALHRSSIDKLMKSLGQELDIKRLGNQNNFLGVSFTNDSKGAWFSQKQYILRILKRSGMDTCKPLSTPMTT